MTENKCLIMRNKKSYLLLEINFLILKHEFLILENPFSDNSTYF